MLIMKKTFEIIKVGESYDGDIAVDDLKYTTSPCLTSNATALPPTTADLGCNFDANSICKWENDPTGQFNWAINKGPTGTILTGPSFDQ